MQHSKVLAPDVVLSPEVTAALVEVVLLPAPPSPLEPPPEPPQPTDAITPTVATSPMKPMKRVNMISPLLLEMRSSVRARPRRGAALPASLPNDWTGPDRRAR